MHWIIYIGKHSVQIKNASDGVNAIASSVNILPGWNVVVDKVDDFVIAKLVNADLSVHLCMLPASITSVIWQDINDVYKKIK